MRAGVDYGARPVSRTRRIVVAVAVVVVAGAGIVAAVAAGGSGDDSGDRDDGARTVQPGAPGEDSRELTDEEAADIDAPEHTPADTAFMQDMIVHHRQALEMAALVASRTQRDDLPVLADRITVSQQAEIEQMATWLEDRGEDAPAAGPGAAEGHHASMPGMATAEQLAELGSVQGPAFDALFLDLMIAHHQGAVTMVEQLYAAGGGLEPAADKVARDAEADQNIEIERMQDLAAQPG